MAQPSRKYLLIGKVLCWILSSSVSQKQKAFQKPLSSAAITSKPSFTGRASEKIKWVAEVHDNENRKTGGRATRTTFYVLSSLFQFIGSDNVSTLSALTLVLHALLVYVAISPANLKQNSIWWFNILCEMLHKHFKWLLRNGLL